MKKQLSKNLIEQFSRQIILKNIGIIGQKKILSTKVLVIGAGGLGCPVAEFLSRSGIGALGSVDYDKVNSIRGINISIVTSSETDKEAYELLVSLGFPINEFKTKKKNEKSNQEIEVNE